MDFAIACSSVSRPGLLPMRLWSPQVITPTCPILSLFAIAVVQSASQNGLFKDAASLRGKGQDRCHVVRTRTEKTLGNPLVAVTSSKKFSARAALVDLQDSSRSMLSECFRQFGIEVVPMTGDNAKRLAKEKFEACVIRVGSEAETVLESARGSRSNNRMIIYGLGGSAKEALKLSRFGLNAVFQEPLERPAALKLVKATQMLVMHEFRRYVRIPVVTEVSIVSGQNHFSASSVELSSGGMSLKSEHPLTNGQPIEISFALLTLPRVWIRGNVIWHKPASKTFGIRFDTKDDRRLRVKEWVESYLES